MIMCGIWGSLSLFLALTTVTIASPLSTIQKIVVPPNNIDVLGGDFGLVTSRFQVEIWNLIAKMRTSSGTGATPKSSLASAVDNLVAQAGLTEMYQGFGGSELVDWLEDQFGMFVLGSQSEDPNTFVCEVYESDSFLSRALKKVLGVPSHAGEKCGRDQSGGTGPYKANYTTDPSLPSRTIYAPIEKPKNTTMPVIVWGGCVSSGTMYANFLTEVASHGYLIIATGLPDEWMGQTVVSDMTRNIDWATSNDAIMKYGNIDRTKIIAAGHSCGGLEALSGTYRDPRVMMTMVFNAGTVEHDVRMKLSELSKPVAYFNGAEGDDIAYYNGKFDFTLLPDDVPALFASLEDSSHYGTFFVEAGGEDAAAAVAFLDWKTKNDNTKKSWFCVDDSKDKDSSDSPLRKRGWKLSDKNGMC